MRFGEAYCGRRAGLSYIHGYETPGKRRANATRKRYARTAHLEHRLRVVVMDESGSGDRREKAEETFRSGAPLRIALLFVVFSALWILLSDRALESITSDPATLTRLQTGKGWAFVLFAGLILYLTMERELRGRRKAEGALARSERLRDLLVEQVQDHAIFAVDERGCIASWNAGAQTMLGYSGAEVMAKPVTNLLVAEGGDATGFDPVAVRAAGSRQYEAWSVRQDGTRMFAQVILTAMRDHEGREVGFSCVIRDLTERKRQDRARAELLIREHAVRMQAEDAAAWATFLAESGEVLAGTLDHREVARTVVRLACDRIADWSAIYLLDEDGLPVRTEVHHRLESRRALLEQPGPHRISRESENLVNQAVRTRNAFLVHALTADRLASLATDESHLDLLRSMGTRSVIVAPLIARDTAIGAMMLVYGDSGRVYGDADVVRAQELAGRAALAIDNARLFHDAETAKREAERAGGQLQRQLDRMGALRMIDRAITGSIDPRITLGVILDQITSLLLIDAAAVLLLDPRTRFLTYASGRGFRTDEITKTRLVLGEGTAGRAALERRPVHTVNPGEADQFRRRELVRREEFVEHAVVPLVAKGEMKGVLEIFHRSQLHDEVDWLSFIEGVASQAAIALDGASLFENLRRTNAELAVAYDRTLEGWSRAIEFRDRDLYGHAQRVTDLTVRLSRVLGIRDSEIVHIRRGALLHDIGKMAIPESILLKAGPLTSTEWVVVRKHPVFAYQLLGSIPFLRPALDIPLFHNEWWNGGGYPYGLQGDAIPHAARVFAVVDVWDALQTRRPHREPWPESRIDEHVRSSAGSQFDPSVVEAFLEMGRTQHLA
jgi:PAS domain S-box-containing protein